MVVLAIVNKNRDTHSNSVALISGLSVFVKARSDNKTPKFKVRLLAKSPIF